MGGRTVLRRLSVSACRFVLLLHGVTRHPLESIREVVFQCPLRGLLRALFFFKDVGSVEKEEDILMDLVQKEKQGGKKLAG